ncbi:MAG: 6,7-dimethyl-8-ribityllumazine synthase [candidate division Zixibacteria bacterium]|nr:6,7-dimethyl-8-ribityllumazine synthase [candidate division Zixibacteria bacterium]
MAPKNIKGKLDASGQKVGIVVSRFNHFLTDKLLEGARDCLERHGAAESDITVYHVPGAFEIPHTAAKLVKSSNFDAIVCLGVIIRGDTPHFDYVAGESASGIAKLSLESDIPVMYGVVTAENLEQAIERCGGKAGNKGWDAALAAIEMIDLDNQI